MERIAVEDLDRSQVDALAKHLSDLVHKMIQVNDGLLSRLAASELSGEQLGVLNEWGTLNSQLQAVSDAFIARTLSRMN